MFLGSNGAIINNSKFYRITLPLALGMSICVYFLNHVFYYKIALGTDGLALATLITILVFNTVKLWFVNRKFAITPFTDKSWKMVCIIFVLFISFYFWNFSLPELMIFNFNSTPIFNIILKSILISAVYIFLVLKLKISNEIDLILKRFYK